MNYNDITVGIVTFKSEEVIIKCLKSIKYIKKIIIYDNSNDIKIKKKIKKIFPKIKFILSKKNLGYGVANNKIINLCKTKYLLILNPDTILQKNCEKELLRSINSLKNNFSIISPISNDKNYGKLIKPKTKKFDKNLFKVNYVKGFAMLIDVAKVKKIGGFDSKIFLYLEEIDLCKRLIKNYQNIYISKKAKIFHLGSKSSNIGFEFEKCRNWHWMWSNVYYKKKHSNFILTSFYFIPKLVYCILKLFIYSLLLKNKKRIIYYYRVSGMFNAIIGRGSWFRPTHF